MADRMLIETFFDEATSTFSYIVLDRSTRQCAIIDSVLDYDPKSGRTRTDSAQKLAERVQELGGQVQWLLETHVHADHLSASAWLRERLGGRIGIGRHITDVQGVFGRLFNAESGFARDGSQFDHLFDDDEVFQIGSLRARALHTPGHTPACMSYLIEDEGPEGTSGPFSWAIPCSCLTTVRRAVISPAAMRPRSTVRSAACSRCRRKPGCTCAMITAQAGDLWRM